MVGSSLILKFTNPKGTSLPYFLVNFIKGIKSYSLFSNDITVEEFIVSALVLSNSIIEPARMIVEIYFFDFLKVFFKIGPLSDLNSWVRFMDNPKKGLLIFSTNFNAYMRGTVQVDIFRPDSPGVWASQ